MKRSIILIITIIIIAVLAVCVFLSKRNEKTEEVTSAETQTVAITNTPQETEKVTSVPNPTSAVSDNNVETQGETVAESGDSEKTSVEDYEISVDPGVEEDEIDFSVPMN